MPLPTGLQDGGDLADTLEHLFDLVGAELSTGKLSRPGTF